MKIVLALTLATLSSLSFAGWEKNTYSRVITTSTFSTEAQALDTALKLEATLDSKEMTKKISRYCPNSSMSRDLIVNKNKVKVEKFYVAGTESFQGEVHFNLICSEFEGGN